MKNLLEFILIHLVNNPDDIRVDEMEQDGEFIYSIHVNQEDIGRVIGKSGHVIQAVRTIAKVRAMKEGTRIRIILEEDAPVASPEGVEPPTEPATEPSAE
ncbi:MAG TPA: KH domain-containing protein [Candidatus Saccharimonadia bacterium]|nr:KH domain-containing protein [Candidatus Saccharimonadia bacterium]